MMTDSVLLDTDLPLPMFVKGKVPLIPHSINRRNLSGV